MNDDFAWKKLCDIVWAQPTRSIAAGLAICDVALAKRCKKANIPLPHRGGTGTQMGRKTDDPNRVATPVPGSTASRLTLCASLDRVSDRDAQSSA